MKTFVSKSFALSFLVIVLFNFSSCLTMDVDKPAGSSISRDWAFGEFINQWGDKTGKYFMVYQRGIQGVFSDSAVNNASLTVAKFTFSNTEGLSFNLYEGGNEKSLVGISSSSVRIEIRTVNSEVKTFTGGIANNTPNTVYIKYSDDLLNIFLQEEKINFRVTIAPMSSSSLRSYYQFDFTPVNFKNAYERMKTLYTE